MENVVRTERKGYFLPKAEIKDYNVMIGGRNFFDQPIKKNIKIKILAILLLLKEMIIQLIIYKIIIISKKTVS